LSVCWPRNKPTFEVIREAPLGGMTTINWLETLSLEFNNS
jgi:hypothetical protein